MRPMSDFNPPDGLLLRVIWRLRRHAAVRRYLTRLPPMLLKDYGHRGPYRPLQVEATICRHKGFSRRFIPHAQALFCDEASVRAAWRDAAINARYEAIRNDLADAFFSGGDYSYADVARYSAETGPEGSTGHGGEGGGHHGGHGGHGGH